MESSKSSLIIIIEINSYLDTYIIQNTQSKSHRKLNVTKIRERKKNLSTYHENELVENQLMFSTVLTPTNMMMIMLSSKAIDDLRKSVTTHDTK